MADAQATYLEAMQQVDPAAAENKRRDLARRQIFMRAFSSPDGQLALQIILALGDVTNRSNVFPGDTGMMLAERAGRRWLALEILDLSGAGLALEPYQAPPAEKAEPGQSSETGAQDGQG